MKRTLFICPSCSSKLSFKDYRPLIIHHDILKGVKTLIHFRRRRYFCSHCNSYHYDKNPFNSSSRFSIHSIFEIMYFLKEHSATFSMTARHFHTSPTKIVQIFDEFGQMPALSLPEAICIDEFQWKHKGKDQYAAVIIDFVTQEIVDILPGRTKKVWNSYLQIRNEEAKNVKFVVSDMFETYRSVKNVHFPNASMAIDSFHVIKNINDLLNKLRIQIMKSQEKNSNEYYLLKKFNWLLLYDAANIPNKKGKYNRKLKRYINYHQLLELILRIDDQLKEAYEIKEEYLLFNQSSTYKTVREDLAQQVKNFSLSTIPSFQNFSNTLISYFDEICNSFIVINGKRLSNGKIESLNSRIKIITKNACGYTNFSRLRNRLIFTLNKNATLTIHSPENLQKIKRQGKPRNKYRKKK